MNSVDRFVCPQINHIDIVKKELLNHKKETHWIWFMFPQLVGLGDSYLSKYYGLKGIKEVKSYLKNDYLKKNLFDLIDILLGYENVNLVDVFGEIDTMKVHSCMTIFYISTDNEKFKEVIDKFYGGKLDNNTIELLKNK